ncbi:MBL fold hydrolase [Aliidiomarina taiwanensis]|uniref:MBL fold hydrolase n=1 Tax=Aliidiomarina taiwanensis TaxID=946228 RepID=A0A432WTK7_9GAMM|nr:MBL fold metallo-hydrolase [Aliidiomarina taiwanensis]RUO37110.1 MBL fold hydrolase [Aliidiomarina taiwanensis]
MSFLHHGAREGVTGSCHELRLASGKSLLVDIGLFQGAETSGDTAHSAGRADANHHEIKFPIEQVEALIITHCHIDHVGRLPWLLIDGFRKPIYCTKATAHLLPMVIEDALKVGMTRNKRLIEGVLKLLDTLLVPIAYDTDFVIDTLGVTGRFKQAGHILGSAFVEVDVPNDKPVRHALHDGNHGAAYGSAVPTGDTPVRVVFSGDLGCKNSPLLPDPAPLSRADYLILESTYGDKNHENRTERQERLRQVIERCVADQGTVLIPAFSIGRTQELLYELEDIMHHHTSGIWKDMVVIVDSPMAAQFTSKYRQLKRLWDKEATRRLKQQRHPLNFKRLHTVNSHSEHERIVRYLQQTGTPCIVIAASGMCTGGRMVNYLKALLPDPRTDVLFVGYQAKGTPGRDIQHYGPRGGYVDLDGQRIWIKAQVHTLGGYSAHADQQELMEFVATAEHIGQIRLVHGEAHAKEALATKLRERFDCEVVIP